MSNGFVQDRPRGFESTDWAGLRSQMPVALNWAYLDHAAVAPISRPAQAAIHAWANELATQGAAEWAKWARRIEGVRASAAKLLNAAEDEIALVRSTTEGINLVAEGFPWREGDNVVVPDAEFPSNLYPWMHLASRGVEARRVPAPDGLAPLDALASACDARTRLVAVSWVGYATGYRLDLDAVAEMAHARGALLFVDAIQGLGALPLDVQKTPVDFLAADGHKWLLGPEGAGLFYSRRSHLNLLRPVGVGWNSVVQTLDFSRIELTFKPTAGRYEGGTYNMPGFMGLGASLDLLAAYDAQALAARVLHLAEVTRERLRTAGAIVAGSADPARQSGIVAFDLPGRALAEVRRRCLERQVLVSVRGGRLRTSAHAYNDESDIDRLIAATMAS